jgi:FdhD protein
MDVRTKSAVVWRIIISVKDSATPNPANIAAFRQCDQVLRVERESSHWEAEDVVVEEPLEIRLVHGPSHDRREKAISVTMRTPGHDVELATGFLLTEGILRDGDDIESTQSGDVHASKSNGASASNPLNSIRIVLSPDVVVNQPTLERNFYTTSSCGICGKASLLALQTTCPPRRENSFSLDVESIRSLPQKLRSRQSLFTRTGGLHGAALAGPTGELHLLREDVGRHNAVDKLVGAAAIADELPLRQSALVLSGRVSFELMQKAVMAGIPMVIAIGAPSTLAIEVARNFDLTLIGFLRDDHFNIYHGASRVVDARR